MKCISTAVTAFLLALCLTSCGKPQNANLGSQLNTAETTQRQSVNFIGKNEVSADIVDDIIMEGTSKCNHREIYNNSFHNISGALCDYVGQEKLEEWLKYSAEISRKSPKEGCDHWASSIVSFVKFFEIPKDVFATLYINTSVYNFRDYNIDVIYSGDDELIEKYYTRDGRDFEDIIDKRQLINEVKRELMIKVFGSYFSDDYLAWVKSNDPEGLLDWVYEKIGEDPYLVTERLWSVPQFIYAFDVKKADFEEILAKLRKSEANRFDLFDYDVDKIYGDKDTLTKAIAEKTNVDAMEEMVAKQK